MMNRPEQVPTHSKQILNDTVNVQEPLGVGRMQPMKSKEAADLILAHVGEHVDALRTRPPQLAKQFAAAGLADAVLSRC